MSNEEISKKMHEFFREYEERLKQQENKVAEMGREFQRLMVPKSTPKLWDRLIGRFYWWNK